MLCAIETGTSDGSLIAASDTKCTPWPKRSVTSAARAIANLVLPQPPGPVNVNSLLHSRRSRASAISYSLPTKLVRGRGRRLPTGLARPPVAVPDAANSSPEAAVIEAHHIQCTPTAPACSVGASASLPIPPAPAPCAPPFAAGQQPTLPMLSSSPLACRPAI